jgi:hypothetical protein
MVKDGFHPDFLNGTDAPVDAIRAAVRAADGAAAGAVTGAGAGVGAGAGPAVRDLCGERSAMIVPTATDSSVRPPETCIGLFSATEAWFLQHGKHIELRTLEQVAIPSERPLPRAP